MAPMGNLPEDIVRGIITALPAKSLVRFKCVRRSWRALISDPDLIKANLNHFSFRPENHSLLIKRVTMASLASDQADYFIRCGGRPDPELDGPDRYLRFSHMPYLVGSCNGLLCLYSGVFDDPDSLKICVYNPSIMQCRVIPKPDCDPGFSYRLGFGFVPVSQTLDDYKVIVILQRHHSEWPRVCVYSLRSSTWRWSTKALHPGLHITMSEQSLMFNGRVHWKATRPGAISGNVDVPHILYLDMASEQFGEIQLPRIHAPPTFPLVSSSIGVLEGFLCVLDHWDNLWVMKVYGVAESWTRRYAISRESIGLYLKPLGFTCSGEVVLEKRSDGWLYSYDPRDQSLEDIELPGLLNDPGNRSIAVSAATYVESLVSVF